jgi:uncharacterized heparinase superfamily protein
MRLASIARRFFVRIGCPGSGPRRPPLGLKPRDNPALASLARRKLAERRVLGAGETAAAILEGRFRFLNEERVLSDPLDWRLRDCPDCARLWRFHLHYQEYLLDLAAEGLQRDGNPWLMRAWQLVADWIEGNPPNDPRTVDDAWHPYCISRRLPAWITLWSSCPPASGIRDQVLRSIFSQASFLERNLEWDVRGNHLLENAGALLAAGSFLAGPAADRWLETGARILRREIGEQVLPHGEHFERSPMYHGRVVEIVLDARDAVVGCIPELSQRCDETAAAMADFLESILHPDGELPLLGDTSLGETTPPGRLVKRAKRESARGVAASDGNAGLVHEIPSVRVVGDHWVYRHGDDFLLFDAGPVGPDHLPAHAHADLLSFQASLRGRRLFVDSGVFNYEEDAMRRYCRSTAAHNVLQIDGQDQCDMWSRFRMGYRGWPGGLQSGKTQAFHWARATHNAYRRLGVPEVGRWLACRPGGPWLGVDWAKGRGNHELTLWLHLHPNVQVGKADENGVPLSLGGTTMQLRYLTPGRVEVVRGWYCPQLGSRLDCPVLRWSGESTLPAVCGWYLVWDDLEGAAALAEDDSGEVILHWRDGQGERELEAIPAARPRA